MKYLILVGDGMADRPLKELDGKTPLEAAKTPNMDFIAKNGSIGLVKTIPEGLEPASDVANLALLGYDPRKYYTGRAPLEAANMGVPLNENMIAFRCNLVTVSKDKMEDYSAGHISSKEASTVIKFIDEKLGTEYIHFYPGVSYRHLMVIECKDPQQRDELNKIKCVPPHNITGKSISKNLPKGKSADVLLKLMRSSRDLLEKHEVNNVRIDLKENPANMIWLWGQGLKSGIPLFSDKFGMEGSVISAVDLVKGIAKISGLAALNVPGATGYYDTDYSAKARYALEALKDKDFVYVHVEAPDEAGHNGDIRAKITAIENFDSKVVGAVLEHFENNKDFRVMVLPDHATPISVRTHTSEPVPFAMYGKGVEAAQASGFSESAAASSKLNFDSGAGLTEYFLKKV